GRDAHTAYDQPYMGRESAREALGDCEDLAGAGEPEVGVAFQFVAEGLIGGVVLHLGFEFGDIFHLIFQNDAIEIAGEIGEDAPLGEFAGCGGFLELRGELAGTSWLRDETIADDDHKSSSRFDSCGEFSCRAPRASARHSANWEGS